MMKKMNNSYQKFFRVLCLFVALSAVHSVAQPNTTQELGIYCQGSIQEYKQYSKAIITKIQSDLDIIYHQHPDWISSFNQQRNPLHDGTMGPITWSWIERFCRDFAMQESPDPVSELPQQLDRIAAFAHEYPLETNILTSTAFADWCVKQEQPLLNEIPQILYKGTDAELLELLRVYATPLLVQTSASPVRPKIQEDKKANRLYLYVLRAEDFETLKKPDALPAAIDSLIGAYKDKDEANTAIAAALKDQLDDIKSSATALIDKNLYVQTTYQLSDNALDNLANNGLSALEIVELNKLPKEPFTDQNSFNKAVNSALAAAEAARIASLPSPETTVTDTPATPINKPNAQQAAAQQLALMRILRESRTTSLVFDKTAANAVKQVVSPLARSTYVPESLVNLMQGIEDIEYPDGQLVHYAVKNALVSSLGICRINKSGSFNNKIAPLDSKQLETLKKDLYASHLDKEEKAALDVIFDETTHQNRANSCSDTYYDNLTKVYNALVKTPIENVYRKELPNYEGKPLKWRGDACGCIPEAIESTAYGIYPYWKVSESAQQFDFSTLSRVGYYGISFNGNGQLTHTNTDNQAKTLLTDDSFAANDFIRVTRMYGSKLDWVIEKDWNEELTGDNESDNKKISLIFSGLQTNLVKLITTPMNDPASRLMPWLSLRIAPRPTKGDGVTFYFKNYPDSAEAKVLFDDFFKTLKQELANAAKQNSRFTNHPHHYFVNVIARQNDYLQEHHVFGYANLIQLLGIDEHITENLTPLEMQEKTKTLILVLLNKPYYNSLAETYAMTSAKTRQITLPVMFMNYDNFDARYKSDGATKKVVSDERHKNLSFIQEGFGGGGFWPMPAWDQKGAEGFNEHLATLFALGYPQSWWAEKLCGYRWLIVGTMNIWLLLVLSLVILVFYVYPQQCRQLPFYIEWILKPLPLAVLIFPPLIVWAYMLIVDSHYPFLSLPSLLCISLVGLTVSAGVDYVKELKQRKPNRNLLQYHKQMAALDSKNPAPNNAVATDETDE